MALQRQTTAINLGNGLDTKTDPKLVQPGSLLVLENGVYKKSGRIDKRYGYDMLSNQTTTSETIAAGVGLATFKSELLQYSGQKIYSYSEGSQKWIDKGSAVSATIKTKQIVNNTYQQSQSDSAIANGVGVYAWIDSRGGARASLYDETTGTILLNDVSLDVGATRVRTVSFNNYLYVFYRSGGSLLVRRASPLNPISFDTAVVVSTDINTTNPTFDVQTVGNVRMYVVFNRQSTPGIRALFLDDAPTILIGALAISTLTAEPATNSLSLITGANRVYYVCYHNNTNGVRGIVTNVGAGILAGPVTIENYVATPVYNITGYPKRGTTVLQVYYEKSAALDHNTRIDQNTLAQNGSVGTPALFLRSVGLFTKAWFYDDPADSVERGYVGIVHSSTLQSTYFIARNDGLICGKMQQGLAGGLTSILQNINTIDTQIYTFSILNKTRLTTENSTLFSLLGVARTEMNFASNESFNTAELGQNLLICGGVLTAYDGVSVVEQNFHLYPENVVAALSVGAGTVPTGTYQYSVCYEWQDNFGNIQRSAPSVPLTVVVSGGPKNVLVAIPTLRLTAKTGIRTNVILQVYRTENNGTVFYRTSSISNPTFNDPSVDTVIFTDTTTDSDLIANDALYTTGGDLDNMAPPSCTYITVFKNRVFLAGLEDENLYWYSKIDSAGVPVEFAAELTQLVDPQGGGLSALSVLDDKVVLFKKDRFYITYGDGPNNTGQLGEFAQPQFVTADAGCSSFRSIVRTPMGLMFKSQKGIYLLNSSLGMEYVGAPVEDFNSLTVRSASLKSDLNQVRFVTQDGVALVYDYFFKKWSTFTNHKGNSSVIWNETFVLLRVDGNVYQENQAVFTDAGTTYSLKMVTSWFTFDNVTGFQRVYDLQFLGEYKSEHILRLKVGYDFSEAYLSNILFVPKDSIPETVYGDDVTYGSVSPFGGENNSYRFKASMTYQKCQAIRFLIEDVISASTPGSKESLTITSLGLQVGIKGHLGRMKESQSIGAQAVS